MVRRWRGQIPNACTVPVGIKSVYNPAGLFTWVTTDVERHRPRRLGGHDDEACRLDRDTDV